MEFDPAKDATNVAKHGISLARAEELELLAYVVDDRFTEPRFRLYGLIDGKAYCVAGTDRDGVVRVISLRAEPKPRRCAAMSHNQKPIVFDDDNPEWTKEDFARALYGDDVPAPIRAAFGKRLAGRPVGSTKTDAKVQVSLRIDPDVLAAFKAGGAGWQSRMNAALRAAASTERKRSAG